MGILVGSSACNKHRKNAGPAARDLNQIRQTMTMKIPAALVLFLVLVGPGLAYAAQDQTIYVLKVDEHEFKVPYRVDADVIAMAVDQELDSLLVGLDRTRDSVMTIGLEHKLIRAQDDNFAVLVNGIEVDYDIVLDDDGSTLIFFVPEFSEEIEIIGTHVIPEFSLGVLIGMATLVSATLVISKTQRNLFRL